MLILAVKATSERRRTSRLTCLCGRAHRGGRAAKTVSNRQVQPHCPTRRDRVWCSAETQPQVRLRGEAALVVLTGSVEQNGLLRGAGATVDCDPTSPRRPGANYWSTRWRDGVVLSGRQCSPRGIVAAECLAVARRGCLTLDDDVVDEVVRLVRSALADMGTSMLADRAAHRPLEWDLCNGVIVRAPAPTAWPPRRTCWLLLAAASDGPDSNGS